MKLSDPTRLNDWRFRDFLVVVLALQLSVLTATGLAQFGLEFPVFRQLTGFFYLSFIPGVILLRIFNVHGLSRISTLLYSVGLSIAFLMFLGFSLNVLSPLLGISEPISSVPLTLGISAAVLILTILSYIRDRAFSSPTLFDTKEATRPLVLAFCLIPILSVSGTYYMNFLDNNFVILLLLSVISILPILVMSRRFSEKLYPLAIFVIALSLLYHTSLISTYITGWDIQSEYYYANAVQANSYWLSSTPSNINAMLSIVMLAPIFSIMCNLNLVWVFKIFYPVLFALVPLGLYGVLRKYIDNRAAFLSCFFFVSVFTFYTELPSLARQQIAELFQVLLMLLMVGTSLSTAKKLTFGVIFAFSLITSHYGLSYVFMFSLVFVWAVFFVRKWQLSRKTIVNSNAFVFLYCIFSLAWYIYVSSSSTFSWALTIGSHMINSISEFANPTAVQGLKIVAGTATSPLYETTKILYLVVNFLISVGMLALLLKRTKVRFEKEYVIFSMANLALLLGGLTVPYLASALGTTRLYHVTLIFLAPFCVVGGKFIWDTLSRLQRASGIEKGVFLKVLSVFFAVFFLFSSGFVYEIARDRPSSISLNSKFDYPRFSEQEIVAAEWLGNEANRIIPIYSDLYRKALLDGNLGYGVYYLRYPEPITSTRNVTYFFLGYRNTVNEEVVFATQAGAAVVDLQNLTLYNILSESNRIYDNNNANSYLHPGD